ncbi:hypothetical protein GYB22_05470 [bacterium]|nr:hypothetical protein [bacterium]
MKKILILSLMFLSILSFAQEREVEAEKLYLCTDRYYYAPGDQLNYSVFLVGDDDFRNTPQHSVKVWLEDPKGKEVFIKYHQFQSRDVIGYFLLPSQGGLYTLKGVSVHQMNEKPTQVFSKEIYIQEYNISKLFVQTQIRKNFYEAADTFKADLALLHAGNQKLKAHLYKYELVYEGDVIKSGAATTDFHGDALIKFAMPSTSGDERKAYLNVSTVYEGRTFSKQVSFDVKPLELIFSVHYTTGLQGYQIGMNNRIVVKGRDVFENDRDFSIALKDSKGKIVKSVSSIHKGMAVIEWVPQAGLNYELEYLDKTAVKLEPARAAAPGIVIKKFEGGHSIALNRVSDEDVVMYISSRGKVLKDIIIPANNELEPILLKDNEYQGVIGVAVYYSKELSQPFAKRLYFSGYKSLFIDEHVSLYDHNVVRGSSQILTVDFPDKQSGIYSVSVISENNLQQIKDHNHNVLSWMYLGAEVDVNIEDPQDYFDPKSVDAEQHLELLMQTLSGSWRRSYASGRVQLRNDVEYSASPLFLSGTLRMWGDPVDEVSVKIKNSSISTITENGYFEMEVPRSMANSIVLEIQKGLEKMEYNHVRVNDLLFSDSGKFHMRKIDTLMVFNDQPFIDEDYGEELAIFQPAVEEEPEEVGRTENSTTSFSGARVDANRVTITSEEISAMPSRSLNSIASVSVMSTAPYYYTWEHNYSYNERQHLWGYAEPFYVNINYDQTQNRNKYRYWRPNQSLGLNNSSEYWYPDVRPNEEGDINLNFSTIQMSGGYRVLIEGVDQNGNAYAAAKYFNVKEMVEVEVNFPKNLAVNDEVQIPVKIRNNQESMLVSSIDFNGKTTRIYLAADTFQWFYLPYNPGLEAEDQYLTLTAVGQQFNQVVKVEEFALRQTASIFGRKDAELLLDLRSMVPGTLEAEFKVYPEFDKSFLQAIEGMIHMPGGCFEQVSSRNYPNIVALMVLNALNAVKDDFREKINKYLREGYNKLTGYETRGGGFEWYGRGRGHESLTAYGLLQFHLMKGQGFDVDEKMMERNMEWLLDQRDAQGGFNFNTGMYGFSSASYEVNNAYITGVLSRISDINLDQEISAIKRDLKSNFDAYKMALLVQVLQNRGADEKADKYLAQLEDHILKQNFKNLTAKHSVMRSTGASLDVEILALTLMCQDRSGEDKFTIQLIDELLSRQQGAGRFGNTQATALTLEALSYYLFSTKYDNHYEFQVGVNNSTRNLDWYFERGDEVYSLDDMVQDSGMIKVKLNHQEESVPASLVFTWIDRYESVEHDEISFDVSFDKEEYKLGESGRLNIVLRNLENNPRSQMVAEVNLPGGVTANTEELRQLIKDGTISYYEVFGSKIYLYILEMGPKQEINFNLSITASMPGKYRSKPDHFMDYYQPEVSAKQVSQLITIKP